jgi:prepilin-type N-terminal cleavage/methylation domain-containing protein
MTVHSPHDAADRRPRRARAGMSLVEVIVALSILGGAMLGLGVFTVRLTSATAAARLRTTAAQLVSDRIEAVKAAPRYAAMESLFVATENPPTGFSGYTRQTMIQHVGGGAADTIDYRIVTVQVTNARLPAPIRKTTVVAPF